MKYFSTRGQVEATTFEEALFSGFAADGGILVPETVPVISPETLAQWKQEKLAYPEVVKRIVRLFVPVDEIPDVDLANLIQTTYETKFVHKEILPVTEIKGDHGSKVKIAEMYHGLTKSFKDFALSLVGQLLSYYLAKRNRHTIVLVGTSGDTGSAAMEAVRDSPNMDIIVLYPGNGRVSPVQELQLKSITSKNVHLFEVDGTNDDLDVAIKKCFPSENLMSINSINWARILIQMAHYVYLYLLDSQSGVKEVNIIVPTGAAGNLVSGLFASKMGVPLKLHFATNENKAVDTFYSEGVLVLGGKIIPTPACAMDIGQPYNVERILYLLANGDTKFVAGVMKDAETGKRTKIPGHMLASLHEVVKGSISVSNQQIYETMKNCWTTNKYMVCPHTATALYYFNQKCAATANGTSSFYIVSTASPYKFPEAGVAAGIPVQDWNGTELLEKLQAAKLGIPKTLWKDENWHKILLDKINTLKALRSTD